MAEHELKAVFIAETSKFASSMDSVKKTLQDTGNTINNSMDGALKSTSNATSGIKNTLKTVGTVLAGAFAIDKIKDFGVSIVKEAASMQAVEAQFAQVFGNLQPEATKAVDALGKEFGMVSSRIKPSMTTMTSMFKGLGMDTEQAMTKAKDAVTLSADAAAFYDMSYEDANSALVSFIKGNYEGGEAISLFANETQMAAFASDELGKDWKNLDEKGKQIVRLKYAQAMQESAGATGQAARESNSLENQVGNLNASWTKFKAVLGGAFLPTVISGIQKLGSFISGINVDSIANGFKSFISWMGSVFSPIIKAIKSNFSEMFNGVDTSNLSTSFKGIKTLVSGLGDLIKNIADGIGYFIDKFDFLIAGVAAGAIAFKAISIAQSLWTTATTVWATVTGIATTVQAGFNAVLAANPIGIVVIAIGALVAAGIALYKNWDTVKAYCSTIWNAIKSFAESVFNGLASFFKNTWSSIKSGVETAWLNIKGYLMALWTGIKMIASTVFDGIKAYFTTVLGIYKTIFTTIWNAIKTVVTTVWNAIKTSATTIFNSIKSFFTTVLNGIKSVFSTVWNAIKSTTSTVFNAVKSTISSIWNSIKSSISSIVNSIKSNISNVWNNIKSTVSSIQTSIKSIITTAWNTVKSSVSTTVGNIKSSISNAWGNIKSITSSTFNNVKSLITNPIESAKNKVSDLVNKIKGFFSNLKLKIPTPSLPSLPHFSLKTGSKTILGKTITYPTGFDVNWYQTGGIFTGASMIGVGENGNEAVVPLSNKSKMRPFAEAVAGMMHNNGSLSNNPTVPMVFNFNVAKMTGSEADVKQFVQMAEKEWMKRMRKNGYSRR